MRGDAGIDVDTCYPARRGGIVDSDCVGEGGGEDVDVDW